MTTGRVKVYEEQRRTGIPLWAWLLPLILILAVLAWFLLRHRAAPAVGQGPLPAAAVRSADALPALGAVHFATNEATLTSEDEAILSRAAEYLQQNPQVHLRVQGFTDATGTGQHNDSLSERRSAAVVQFLAQKGIAVSRLTGEGFGPADPVGSNATADGKADNRRVELFQQ